MSNDKMEKVQIKAVIKYPSKKEIHENFMFRVVTQDKTWIHHFDPESKKQSMQAHPLLKFKRVSLAGKVMASIFWG